MACRGETWKKSLATWNADTLSLGGPGRGKTKDTGKDKRSTAGYEYILAIDS
jgi:hypothetical protein